MGAASCHCCASPQTPAPLDPSYGQREHEAEADAVLPEKARAEGDEASECSPVSEERQGAPPDQTPRALLEGPVPEGAKDAANWTDAWARALAQHAEAEATELMKTAEVLRAEAVLSEALRRLAEAGRAAFGAAAQAAVEASDSLRRSPVHMAVMQRTNQYDTLVSHIFGRDDFKLLWEDSQTQLWFRAHPSGKSFEYKAKAHVAAPLSYCLVSADELDLVPRFEPLLIGAPEALGEKRNRLLVTRSLLGVLMFRVEVIIEILRFFDDGYGFMAECIRSDFPAEDIPVPRRSWRNLRIDVFTHNLWFPVGGGQVGTILTQSSTITSPVVLPQSVVSYAMGKMAQNVIRNMREQAAAVPKHGSPWLDRLQRDEVGLYKAAREVEAAADRRAEVSMQSMPGPEVMQRATTLLHSGPTEC